jgi:hypothetical protein
MRPYARSTSCSSYSHSHSYSYIAADAAQQADADFRLFISPPFFFVIKKQVRYSYSYSAGDAAQQADTTALKKEKNGVPKKGDTAVTNDESRERSGTLVVHVAAVQALA